MNFETITIRILPTNRVSAEDAAKVMGRTPKTLANWRSRGVGPSHVRIHGRVFYDVDEVREHR